ncbi:hypothetical protein SteCoe_32220 [Stentor coeruleus]|uniref:RING-type domain-containing protein n=1 Tax=Stentor coeruleus TaxID=5963 RepID=A0A1R2AZP1_9CILI|nr:hypothetical protein SteCoe_32220 [Stentor coeruleus]
MEEEKIFKSESIRGWDDQEFKIVDLPRGFDDFYTCLGFNMMIWLKLGEYFKSLEIVKNMRIDDHLGKFLSGNNISTLRDILANLSNNKSEVLICAKEVGNKVFNRKTDLRTKFSLLSKCQDLFAFRKANNLDFAFITDKETMHVVASEKKNPLLLFKRNVFNNEEGMQETYSLLVPINIYKMNDYDSIDTYRIPFRHSEGLDEKERTIIKFSRICVYIDKNDDLKIIKMISSLYSLVKSNPVNFSSLGAFLKKFLNGSQICFACNRIYPINDFPIQCSAHENFFLCRRHFNQSVCLHCRRKLSKKEISILFNEDCAQCSSSKKVSYHFKVCVECISTFNNDDIEIRMNEISEDSSILKFCSACDKIINEENFEYYLNCYHLVHKSCKVEVFECPACYINEKDFMIGKRPYEPLIRST